MQPATLLSQVPARQIIATYFLASSLERPTAYEAGITTQKGKLPYTRGNPITHTQESLCRKDILKTYEFL